MNLRAITLGSILVTSACAGGAGLGRAQVMNDHKEGKGVVRVYPATFDQAWAATEAAMRWNRAEAVEQHKDERYMLAGATDGTLAAWLMSPGDTAPPGTIKIRVITRKSYPLSLSGPTEEVLHADIQKALAIVKKGQTLPASAP